MVGEAKKIPKNAQPCESCGQTWWLSEVTPKLRRVYASLVRSRARQQLIDDKAVLSPEDYEAESDRLQDRIDAGAYDWGPPVETGGIGAGKAIRAALSSTEGFILAIQMLLAETHDEVSFKQVEEIINGNPDAVLAAYRAAQGLLPLASTPAKQPGTETEKPEQAAVAASS